MEFTYVIQMYKRMVPIRNGINSINILYKGFFKIIPIYYGEWVKNLKSTFKYVFIELNKMKLTAVI